VLTIYNGSILLFLYFWDSILRTSVTRAEAITIAQSLTFASALYCSNGDLFLIVDVSVRGSNPALKVSAQALEPIPLDAIDEPLFFYLVSNVWYVYKKFALNWKLHTLNNFGLGSWNKLHDASVTNRQLKLATYSFLSKKIEKKLWGKSCHHTFGGVLEYPFSWFFVRVCGIEFIFLNLSLKSNVVYSFFTAIL
jgi:hypothetical protein